MMMRITSDTLRGQQRPRNSSCWGIKPWKFTGWNACNRMCRWGLSWGTPLTSGSGRGSRDRDTASLLPVSGCKAPAGRCGTLSYSSHPPRRGSSAWLLKQRRQSKELSNQATFIQFDKILTEVLCWMRSASSLLFVMVFNPRTSPHVHHFGSHRIKRPTAVRSRQKATGINNGSTDYMPRAKATVQRLLAGSQLFTQLDTEQELLAGAQEGASTTPRLPAHPPAPISPITLDGKALKDGTGSTSKRMKR